MKKIGAKVGAVLGGVGFLIFGIVPGFYYGGFGTLALLSKLVGGPVTATLGIKMLLILGTIIGMLCALSLFLVVGAVLGAVLSSMLSTFEKEKEVAVLKIN